MRTPTGDIEALGKRSLTRLLCKARRDQRRTNQKQHVKSVGTPTLRTDIGKLPNRNEHTSYQGMHLFMPLDRGISRYSYEQNRSHISAGPAFAKRTLSGTTCLLLQVGAGFSFQGAVHYFGNVLHLQRKNCCASYTRLPVLAAEKTTGCCQPDAVVPCLSERGTSPHTERHDFSCNR